MLKHVVKVAAIPVALSAFLVGCSENDIVAKVEDKKITEQEFVEELKQLYGTEVLDTLLAEKIIEIEAEAQNISVPQEEIDAEYELYAEQYGSEKELLASIEEYGMEKEDIVEDIHTYLLTMKVMAASIELTDEEIATYFEENRTFYDTPAQVEVQQIIVANEPLANEVMRKLEQGETFAALAKQYSIDVDSAEQGGVLGFIEEGTRSPVFDEIVFQAKVGTLLAPFETEDGFHIVKVTDQKEGKKATLDEVHDIVSADLLNERIEVEYEHWLDSKYEEYEVLSKLFQ